MMKRLVALLLATGIAGAALMPAGIRAQSVPTATPVPTPVQAGGQGALPGGKRLIEQMYAVMRRAKAVRIGYTGTYSDGTTESGAVAGTEDLGVRAHVLVLHESQTLTPLKEPQWATQTVWDEIITRHTDAVRSDYQLWFCSTLPKGEAPSYRPITYWRHVANAVNQGAVVIDGVPTWHVTALNVVEKPGKRYAIVTDLDYYIAQGTYRLVRQDKAVINSAIYSPGNYHLFTLTLDFSHYGEKIAAAIPKGCRAAKG